MLVVFAVLVIPSNLLAAEVEGLNEKEITYLTDIVGLTIEQTK